MAFLISWVHSELLLLVTFDFDSPLGVYYLPFHSDLDFSNLNSFWTQHLTPLE